MVREDRKSTIKIEQGGRVEEGARGQKWNSRSMREWLKSGSGGGTREGKKMSGTTSGRRMKKSFRADCSSALRARRYRE